jgi:hypothetical protein
MEGISNSDVLVMILQLSEGVGLPVVVGFYLS